jgi:hypothetical protein
MAEVKYNQLSEKELYEIIMNTDELLGDNKQLTAIRPFIEIAKEFDPSIYSEDWKNFTKQFKDLGTRDQKSKLKEPLAKKIAKLIFKNIKLEEEDEYHSPTAEETQQQVDKLKKELGLPVPAAKTESPKRVLPKTTATKTESPKRVLPKTKAKKTSKYENILDRYTPTDIEKATKAINKTIQNDQSSENLVEYLDALKKKYVKKFLENLDENTENSILLNACIYHYLKDVKKNPGKSRSQSPVRRRLPSPVRRRSPSPERKSADTKSIYNDLVKGYTTSQKDEAKDFIKEKLKGKNLSTSNLLKFLEALKRKEVTLLQKFDENTKESILLNACIYHTLKDIKNTERSSGHRLEYLKQLYKGKNLCDNNKPCDVGECDLKSKMCVDETMTAYYEGMEKRTINGKNFLGTKEILDKAFPQVDEVKEAVSEPEEKEEVVSEPEEEEVDLDVNIKDLGKLTELQRALVECLMPSTKP